MCEPDNLSTRLHYQDSIRVYPSIPNMQESEASCSICGCVPTCEVGQGSVWMSLSDSLEMRLCNLQESRGVS